jgi:putative ABC transport system permease protein
MIAIAWRNLWRQSRRTLITASAMAVGIALCMSMIALSDGLYAQMFDVMVTRKLGHVQVHHHDFPGRRLLYDTVPQEKFDAISATAGVTAATARLFGYGLVSSEETSAGGQIIGILPDREQSVSLLEEKLTAGRLLSGEPTLQSVIGSGLADTLEAEVGTVLVIVTQASDGSMTNELSEVVGIVRTGDEGIDRAGVYMHLSDAQALFALPDQVHEILVLGADPAQSSALASAVRAVESEDLVRTWVEADPTAAQMMGMQNVGSGILLGVVFSVAALGVLNTMLMSVFERTRELGLMAALGLNPAQVMRLILTESVLLAAIAVVLGGLLGAVLDGLLVVYGLDMSGSGGEGFSMQGMQFDPVIKGVVRPVGVIATLACVFIVSILAAFWPALRAARLRPVEAMRQV